MFDFLLRPFRRRFGQDKQFYAMVDDLFGFLPNNIELYKLALIHKSASISVDGGHPINNERLEYLGDAVIEAVTSDYLFIEGDGQSNARFFAWLPETELEDEEEMHESILFKSSPYESSHPWIGDERKCPYVMTDDPESWLVYIPFDPCAFKLGGSLLAYANGHNGGPAPQIMDADYFIDCYEVVREMVEDGIISAGISIGNGGLATAAVKFCEGKGARFDISGIMSSYQENDSTRVLFGEIPGVLVQISDNDYDYFDSQMILQDIAYYPLGHPSESAKGVRFSEKGRNGVAEILASLLGQTSEGED